MTRRRVLVTGAGGFVGSALTEGFAALGWDVVAIDRAFDGALPRDRVRRITADLAEGVPDDVGRVDVAVHGAWVTTAPDRLGVTRAEYTSANLQPLREVLRWVGQSTPTACVFLSSSGVFAADDAPDALTDVDEPTSDAPYALAKRTGEELAATAVGDTAMYVVRLGYLFGPGEVARPSRPAVSWIARWIAAAREGRPLEVSTGDPRRDWTYAPDLAAALVRVVDGPPVAGPIHLCSPYVYHDHAVAAAVSAALARGTIVTVPAAGRVKPPMVASDLPALRDVEWTTVAEGLRAIVGGDSPTARREGVGRGAVR